MKRGGFSAVIVIAIIAIIAVRGYFLSQRGPRHPVIREVGNVVCSDGSQATGTSYAQFCLPNESSISYKYRPTGYDVITAYKEKDSLSLKVIDRTAKELQDLWKSELNQGYTLCERDAIQTTRIADLPATLYVYCFTGMFDDPQPIPPAQHRIVVEGNGIRYLINYSASSTIANTILQSLKLGTAPQVSSRLGEQFGYQDALGFNFNYRPLVDAHEAKWEDLSIIESETPRAQARIWYLTSEAKKDYCDLKNCPIVYVDVRPQGNQTSATALREEVENEVRIVHYTDARIVNRVLDGVEAIEYTHGQYHQLMFLHRGQKVTISVWFYPRFKDQAEQLAQSIRFEK